MIQEDKYELLFWSGLSRLILDASLWRRSGHVEMGGASRENPGTLAGEGVRTRQEDKELEDTSGLHYFARFAHDLDQVKWQENGLYGKENDKRFTFPLTFTFYLLFVDYSSKPSVELIQFLNFELQLCTGLGKTFPPTCTFSSRRPSRSYAEAPPSASVRPARGHDVVLVIWAASSGRVRAL